MNAHINESGDITLPAAAAQPPVLHPAEPLPRIELQAALEGILFVQNQAMAVEKLAELLNMDPNACRDLVLAAKTALDNDEKRGLQIIVNDLGIQLATKAVISPYIQRLDGQRVTSLSIPALETLSVIAFKQPITKAEIEAVRGVNCDGVISTLLEKKLIYVSGEKQVIGRPRLYSTTQDFLYYFGIKSLKELPVPSVEMPEAEALKEIQDQLGGEAPDLPDRDLAAAPGGGENSAAEPSGELRSEPMSESQTDPVPISPEKSGGSSTGEGGPA